MCVMFSLLEVLRAIKLNNQLRFQTYEIKNVVTVGMLAAKLETAHLPAAQVPPQTALCIR